MAGSGQSAIVATTQALGELGGDRGAAASRGLGVVAGRGGGRQYGGMKADEAKRLKELERENARLKKLLAEAELEKAMLKELAEGNF